MEEFHMPLKENFQELVQHGKSDFPIQYYVNSLHIAGNSVPLHWHPNLEFFVVQCLDRVFSMLQEYGEIGRYGEVPELRFNNAPGTRECFEIRVLREISRAWEILFTHRGEMELAPAVKNEHVLQIRMQKMIGFIQEHYAEDVSLQDIANAASISRSEASRCFQSYLHTSPVNYLLKYRVERSMQLLRDGNMTVEAVALECGFSSSAYFCKLFRSHTGMTPKQYRSK